VALAPIIQGHVQIRLLQRRLGHLPLGAAVQHGDDRTDHLQVAELLGGDVEQHVLAAGVLFSQRLREIAHRRRQLALRTAELLEHERRQAGVRLGDAHRVHQSLVVNEH